MQRTEVKVNRKRELWLPLKCGLLHFGHMSAFYQFRPLYFLAVSSFVCVCVCASQYLLNPDAGLSSCCFHSRVSVCVRVCVSDDKHSSGRV